MVITQVNILLPRKPRLPEIQHSALLSDPEFVTQADYFSTSHFEHYKNEVPLMAGNMFKVYAKHRCQDDFFKMFQKECNTQRATAKATKRNRKSAVRRATEQGATQKTLANKEGTGISRYSAGQRRPEKGKNKFHRRRREQYQMFLCLHKVRGTSSTISSMRIDKLVHR